MIKQQNSSWAIAVLFTAHKLGVKNYIKRHIKTERLRINGDAHFLPDETSKETRGKVVPVLN
jgi:hypothetical protein